MLLLTGAGGKGIEVERTDIMGGVVRSADMCGPNYWCPYTEGYRWSTG